MKELIHLAKQMIREPDRQRDLLKKFTAQYTFPIVNDQRATFFYWNDDQTDSVYLLHWVYGLESRQEFRRLPGSNAFWLSIDLPYTARVEYKFEIHRENNRYWSRDPHNSTQAFDPFGSNSVCSMPGYTLPNWASPDERCREGKLEEFFVHSKVYQEERPITVYLPNEYKPKKRYPLLICHDGSDYRKYASMIHVLDNLIHRKEVSPLIVAFTDGVHRNPEYAANPKQAQFLVEELLPALERKYRTASGPENRGLMGASFGGVSSLFTAWRYPGVFHKLLLQSGSFAFTDIGEHGRGELWDPVVDFVNALREDLTPLQGNIYMSCGVFESLVYYNRTLAPLFKKQGLNVRYVESKDGHNWINWRDRLREGLSWLYPGHLWMYYE